MNSKSQGFTLVELAIVLVIVGLLLGGVMQGRELITSSKIKTVAQDMQSWATAVYSYQDKRRYLPGDDSSVAVEVEQGDGNGAIDTVTERQMVFKHLKDEGFVSGDFDGTRLPVNAFGGEIRIESGGGFRLASCYSGLTLDQAQSLDVKLDGVIDGTKGALVGAGAANNNPTDASAFVEGGWVCYQVY